MKLLVYPSFSVCVCVCVCACLCACRWRRMRHRRKPRRSGSGSERMRRHSGDKTVCAPSASNLHPRSSNVGRETRCDGPCVFMEPAPEVVNLARETGVTDLARYIIFLLCLVSIGSHDTGRTVHVRAQPYISQHLLPRPPCKNSLFRLS